MNGKLTLLMNDGRKERETVLESQRDVIVRKGRGGAWFDSNVRRCKKTKAPREYIHLFMQLKMISMADDKSRKIPPR